MQTPITEYEVDRLDDQDIDYILNRKMHSLIVKELIARLTKYHGISINTFFGEGADCFYEDSYIARIAPLSAFKGLWPNHLTIGFFREAVSGNILFPFLSDELIKFTRQELKKYDIEPFLTVEEDENFDIVNLLTLVNIWYFEGIINSPYARYELVMRTKNQLSEYITTADNYNPTKTNE